MKDKRKEKILEILNDQKSIKISDLLSYFNVSVVTLRKDLKELENNGLIIKQHGRALIADGTHISFEARKNANTDKKKKIAKAAANLIKDINSVTLDSGTTCAFIAEEIVGYDWLSVVTNSLSVSNIISKSPRLNLSVAGGICYNHSLCLIGAETEEYLSKISTDYAFVSCTGIRNNIGMCVGSLAEVGTKRALMRTGHKVVGVFDDSKFETTSMYMYAKFTDLDIIITTRGSSEQAMLLDDLAADGIEIVYVD